MGQPKRVRQRLTDGLEVVTLVCVLEDKEVVASVVSANTRGQRLCVSGQTAVQVNGLCVQV